MRSPPRPRPRPAAARWYLPALAAALLLGGAALAVYVTARWRHAAVTDGTPPAAGKPFVSPYKNTDPSVRYVGNAACAACHVMEADSYRHHPMARAVTPVDRLAAVEDLSKAAHNPFEKLGFLFQVETRKGRVYHKAVRPDARGTPLTEREEQVRYALGSRERGCGYLIDHDGYIYQSPISWFTQAHTWDVSPGFPAALVSGRPIHPACFFCHTDHVRPVADTDNRYREPVFDREYGIGCERCHGPGELHVERWWKGDRPQGDFDDTIVNPARLPPDLREAVCQQCHLVGMKRVLRRGRDVFDYRPGLPLHDYWSVFVLPEKLTDDFKAVGQVEQMYSSKCFRASGGKLGCLSCHDPHGLPGPAQRITFYRSRCLQCHEDTSCRLPKHDRLARSKGDSCIDCHMPRFRMSEIAHTAGTDHRILRRTDVPGLPREPGLDVGDRPIVNFYQSQLDPGDEGAARDLGVALAELARTAPHLSSYAASLAAPLLEKAVAAAPDDVTAWEAKSDVDHVQGRSRQALDDLVTALKVAPHRESALHAAAVVATELREYGQAIGYWQTLVAVNPWRFSYHQHLCQLLAQAHDWSGALAEAQAALRLDPSSVPVRRILVECCLRTGRKDRAKQELQKLLALSPAEADKLRRWFEDLAR
jgi:tetratricopeptide (TPR) repeat protein